jgi:hypothetical protein
LAGYLTVVNPPETLIEFHQSHSLERCEGADLFLPKPATRSALFAKASNIFWLPPERIP